MTSVYIYMSHVKVWSARVLGWLPRHTPQPRIRRIDGGTRTVLDGGVSADDRMPDGEERSKADHRVGRVPPTAARSAWYCGYCARWTREHHARRAAPTNGSLGRWVV